MDRCIRTINIRNDYIKLAIKDGVGIKVIAKYLSLSCETVRLVGKGVLEKVSDPFSKSTY